MVCPAVVLVAWAFLAFSGCEAPPAGDSGVERQAAEAVRAEARPIGLHEAPVVRHRTRAGEDLALLARRHRTSVDELLALNPALSGREPPAGTLIWVPEGKPSLRAVHAIGRGTTEEEGRFRP